MDINDIEQILKLLKQHDVMEFELQQDGVTVKLSRGAQVAAAHGPFMQRTVDLEPAIVGNGTGQYLPVAQSGAPVPDDSRYTKIESPIVGTFYRKPSPEAEPFVKEGDHVKKGDTLCIIEAMKLMNEIDAPCSGKIHKIMISDAQVVEFGEVLFLIEPD